VVLCGLWKTISSSFIGIVEGVVVAEVSKKVGIGILVPNTPSTTHPSTCTKNIRLAAATVGN
jgi:hypothetical protein